MAGDDVLDWFFDGLASLDLAVDPNLVTTLTGALPEGAEHGWLLYWRSRFEVPIEWSRISAMGLERRVSASEHPPRAHVDESARTNSLLQLS